MKEIGLTTFYNAYNYGAFLQCFALMKVLEPKYHVSIIQYACKEISNSYKLFQISNIKQLIKSFLLFIPHYKRKKNFDFCISEEFHMGSLKKCYDCIIAGSDQIWNLNLTGGFDEVYSLCKFPHTHKISYATSVGDEYLIAQHPDIYQKILTNIDRISVREETAKTALSSFTDKEIKVTLDPTLLLTDCQWNLYLKPVKPLEPYILSYFIIACKEHFQILSQISNKLKLPVISYSEFPREKNILKRCYTDDPFQFLSRIQNADIVFTSSFHGMIFSILFHKIFWIVLPEIRKSRILDLLYKLGLTDRIIKSTEDVNTIDLRKSVDYNKVDQKLELLRKDSQFWLFKAIGEGE